MIKKLLIRLFTLKLPIKENIYVIKWYEIYVCFTFFFLIDQKRTGVERKDRCV